MGVNRSGCEPVCVRMLLDLNATRLLRFENRVDFSDTFSESNIAVDCKPSNAGLQLAYISIGAHSHKMTSVSGVGFISEEHMVWSEDGRHSGRSHFVQHLHATKS